MTYTPGRYKLKLLLLGILWGIVIASILSSIGDIIPQTTVTAFVAVRGFIMLSVVAFAAIETYRVLQEEIVTIRKHND